MRFDIRRINRSQENILCPRQARQGGSEAVVGLHGSVGTKALVLEDVDMRGVVVSCAFSRWAIP